MSEKKAQEPKKKEAEEKAADSGAKEAPSGGRGGSLKIAIVAVAAMALGGVVCFVLLRTILAPPAAAPSGEAAPAATETAQAEAEEPIVAPTKGGSEVGQAAASGGSHAGTPPAEGAAAAETGPITVELKPFTTNLNEPSGRRFLKVAVGLEVENQEAADELNRKMSDIQDSILILLSSQSIEDIQSVDGKERLRGQILNRTNGFMTKNKVKKVKYSDFVIQ
ncbi:MAG: flagellar basal body-associated FliL family protein [Deltaproteobacteria bacterium]|jgi:flagellar FliL protein|nr:flagellar basal body-associated FliL family protein [Deltaproteobacteria bacterium]